MLFSLRNLTLAMALCGVVSTPLMAAESAKPLRVLASLPITYGLGEVLLKGTDVSLERAAPANLPGSRQTAYFTGRGAPALNKLATGADAVIGVRSLWADDPLYPFARRSNIRIVEVDAARPVDGALPGIAVQADLKVDGLNSQPWLASNNMGRMADVMAADLVRLALAEDLPIVPLPGPNAALTALVASGLDARQFAFIGFLPKITAKQKKLLMDMSRVPVTLIFYEAPHRLKETLDTLIKYLGDRQAVTARELTKKFETFRRGTLKELRAELDENDPRGEYVILVEGWNEDMAEGEEEEASWEAEALELAKTLPQKEAARKIAAKFHMGRRDVYQYLLKNGD